MDIWETVALKLLHLVQILRVGRLLRVGGSTYAFSDYFKGLEKAEAVRRIFGEKTEAVLRNLRIEFARIGGYMWVNSLNGHLMISSKYLNTGNKIDIYLDIVHELVHIRQHMEGKDLFASNFAYVERPTEIEAYRYAVEEARKLGLSEKRICEYLKTEWMSTEDFRKLTSILNVECEPLNNRHNSRL